MTVSGKAITRIENLIWVLVYGGLLILVLGLATRLHHAATGWSLIAVGGCFAAVGAVLVWVRSRLHESTIGEKNLQA